MSEPLTIEAVALEQAVEFLRRVKGDGMDEPESRGYDEAVEVLEDLARRRTRQARQAVPSRLP